MSHRCITSPATHPNTPQYRTATENKRKQRKRDTGPPTITIWSLRKVLKCFKSDFSHKYISTLFSKSYFNVVLENGFQMYSWNFNLFLKVYDKKTNLPPLVFFSFSVLLFFRRQSFPRFWCSICTSTGSSPNRHTMSLIAFSLQASVVGETQVAG